MAYPKSHNPFADDDDDDVEQDFRPKSKGYGDDPDSGLSEAERKQRYLQQEVMRTAQSAVDSSYRSIGYIYESEKMGVEAAEVCQWATCCFLGGDTSNTSTEEVGFVSYLVSVTSRL